MAMKLQLKREFIHEHVQPTSNTLGAAFCLGPATSMAGPRLVYTLYIEGHSETARIDSFAEPAKRLPYTLEGQSGNCRGSTGLSNQHRRLPSSSRTLKPLQTLSWIKGGHANQQQTPTSIEKMML